MDFTAHRLTCHPVLLLDTEKITGSPQLFLGKPCSNKSGHKLLGLGFRYTATHKLPCDLAVLFLYGRRRLPFLGVYTTCC
jgi:hypothetical protein